MTHRLRLFSTLAAGALLCACTTVGPDFHRPAVATDRGFAMAGDAQPVEAAHGERIAQDWWTLFQSPEIDAAVRQAIAGNRDLASAEATLDQARDAVDAKPARLVIDGNAALNYERINFAAFGFTSFPGASGPIPNPTVLLYSFGATGKYDFDLFGARRRGLEAMYAKVETQAHMADAAYLTLTAQVVGQAVNIAALRAQIATAQQVVDSDRQNLALVRKAYELGGGTRLDVSTVEAELASDEGQIIPLTDQLAQSRHALALLMGKAPSEYTAPDFDLDRIAQPQSIPVSLPSSLVHDRPDILAAEARLHAATAQIGVAEAARYPSLNLTAALTQTALHPLDLFSYASTGWSLAPQLAAPLFHGRELKARRREAEAAARAALADYQQTVLKAFVQVADCLQALAHDDEAIAAAQRQYDAAADGLTLQRLRYKDGKTGLLPVLDSQRSFARAGITLVRAKAKRLQDAAQLLYATGRNWNGEVGAARPG